MDNESDTHEVILHVYDLTKGMARTLAPAFLGIELEGVWHSGVVIFGSECTSGPCRLLCTGSHYLSFLLLDGKKLWDCILCRLLWRG